jgi:Cu/Ag efflux pump CusA
MRWIVGSSLRFRWLVLFAAAALIVFGIGETRNADLDVFPEFAPPRVEIQTIAVGNSSEQVEELITVPLENQLNGIPGLEEMRSRSTTSRRSSSSSAGTPTSTRQGSWFRSA